jgi:acyl-CoA reductase-like NAD-dependent aldehyde dehydrogenase
MLKILNPADGSLIRELPEEEDVAGCYKRARAAQPAWADVPLKQKLSHIGKFNALVKARIDDLAKTLTKEMGKPISQARNELNALGPRIDFFLQHAEKALASQDVFVDASLKETITHDPLGVVVNVSAWNYPWFVGSNVFVPALLAGNSVLYKPSEFATLTGLAIGELMVESGVPKDVFQVVVGAGRTGAALVEQPVDGVFFTGSYATGARIAAACAPRMVKVQLELGGKDPAYVRDDVDVKTAAESLADGAMYNAGQSCCAVERVYVHARIYDAFVAHFVATVKGFAIGDPMDEKTYIGPLAREAQISILEHQVQDAISRGGKLLSGGKRIQRAGNWFEPTVIADASHAMALMRDESFGPVIGIQKVSGDDEAVGLMNDSAYGLTAGVYAKDEKRASALLARVRAGSAYWNCCDRVSPRLPWSGIGHSGVGLTLSTYGIQAFARPRAWHLRAP